MNPYALGIGKQPRPGRLVRPGQGSAQLPEPPQELTYDLLLRAFRKLDEGVSCGPDGVSCESFKANLSANLQALLGELRCSTYSPSLSNVQALLKEDGATRPVEVACVRDRIVQRALVDLIGPNCEASFLPCSHGYRAGYSSITAVQQLRRLLKKKRRLMLVEADIVSFFSSVPHDLALRCLATHVNDAWVLRIVEGWLRVGTVGQPVRLRGIPQGHAFAPLVSNLVLHEVLDSWLPVAFPEAALVRYADDFTILMESARRGPALHLLLALERRFTEHGLHLHPLRKRQPRRTRVFGFGPGVSSTLDFLGFTHRWRRRGGLLSLTSNRSFTRGIEGIARWLRESERGGRSLAEQFEGVLARVSGHLGYYGQVAGNAYRARRFAIVAAESWAAFLGPQRARQPRHRNEISYLRLLGERAVGQPGGSAGFPGSPTGAQPRP